MHHTKSAGRIAAFNAITDQIRALRRRSALLITDTEDRLIAAAAIIGFNRWTSPRKVWLDKTWRRLGLPQIPDEASEAARWGTRLESVVADAFAEKTGLAVVDPKFMYVQRQAGRAPRVHNPDRAVYDPDLGAWVPLEIKTCSQ